MTLNETWKNCLSMWRWIAKQKKAGDRRWVDTLKKVWIENHGFSEDQIEANCFFCEYDADLCDECPGKLVDREFDCRTNEYHYRKKPIAFCNKLVSLNRKRKK